MVVTFSSFDPALIGRQAVPLFALIAPVRTLAHLDDMAAT
jgi:hypothetical protein